MDYAIECTGLEKRYPDFTLGPINLKVERGTVCGIVGSNGAGKTTLIKLLLGLTFPNAGTVSLFGTTCSNPENLPDSTKARIGVVLDTCAFTQASKVSDVAQLGRAAYKNWDPAMFSNLAARFDLDSKKQVSKLSRGMGMKLSIAFALAHHPELLILDEATAGLDPIARDEMLDMLRDYMADEAHTILMSTHITSDLEKISDNVICIDDGQILFELPKEAICDEAGIAHVKSAQLEQLLADPNNETLTVIRREFGADILVPDRFKFAKEHPEIPVDRTTVEDYMNMVLKGDAPC